MLHRAEQSTITQRPISINLYEEGTSLYRNRNKYPILTTTSKIIMQTGNLWNVFGNMPTDFKAQQLADVSRYIAFSAGETYGPHHHFRIEINYVTKGNCILDINNESINFKEGEIMIIGSEANHLFRAGAEGVQIMQLEFQPDIFTKMSDKSEHISSKMNTMFAENAQVIKIVNAPRIILTITNIINELKNKKPYYQHLVLMGYAELFALVNRYLEESYMPMCNNEAIQKAIAFIRHHYMEEITITEVAKYSKVSERYLRKLFTQHLQLSPLEYLNQIRINKALDLLKNADYSVKKVSSMCGFQSPQYFSRVFKKQTGSCPRSITK